MEKGLSFTATMRVTAEVTAEYIGSGDLAVLATISKVNMSAQEIWRVYYRHSVANFSLVSITYIVKSTFRALTKAQPASV